MDVTRILCLDDHAFIVEGLRARLAAEDDLEIVGHLTRPDDLVAAVERTKADLVLMDIDMPGGDPFAAAEDLRRAAPDVRIVLFSAYVRDGYIDAAYRVGAWGYLSKADPPDAVVEGIRKVAAGKPAFSRHVLDRAERPGGGRADVRSKLDTLTPREMEILRLIARGLPRQEIARHLCRSPMTVDNHRKSIMRKLGISDRGELVRFAIGEGLVEV